LALAEKDFSADEWEPIRSATAVRAGLGRRPKPSRLLLWVAFQLQWPGLIQGWARRHPRSYRNAAAATKMLGPDYPRRTLRLLKTMRNKLK